MELAKLRARATEGMDTNFALLSLSVEEAQLENSYNMAIRIKELKKIMKLYDMADAFTIYLLDETDNNSPQIEKDLALLKDYMKLMLDQVKTLVHFFQHFGKDYDLQNLQWTQDLLENLCKDELRDKVEK